MGGPNLGELSSASQLSARKKERVGDQLQHYAECNSNIPLLGEGKKTGDLSEDQKRELGVQNQENKWKIHGVTVTPKKNQSDS
jgi:hypothetical protein